VFVELVPLLACRTVLITAVKVGDNTLRVNGSSFSEVARLVLPRRAGSSAR
jgi:hypothetical protein